MALTTTTLVNAASKAAATPVRVANAAVTTLQATSASLALFGKVTVPAVLGSATMIRLYYAVVPYDGTDGIEPQVVSMAKFVDLKWSTTAAQAAVTATLPEPVSGAYLHTWLEVPNLPAAAVVTLTLVESPLTLVSN